MFVLFPTATAQLIERLNTHKDSDNRTDDMTLHSLVFSSNIYKLQQRLISPVAAAIKEELLISPSRRCLQVVFNPPTKVPTPNQLFATTTEIDLPPWWYEDVNIRQITRAMPSILDSCMT